jgi:predicted permease
MQSIAKQLEAQYPDTNRDQGASVMSLSEVMVGDIRPVLLVLLGGAGLLLLIACVNVASLILVRSETRRRELAVRSALGASKGRLIRQFLTESLVLVAIGSVLGVAISQWLMQLLVGLIPAQMMASMPFLAGAGLNLRVGACAGGIALAATIVCSLAPALRLSGSGVRAGIAEGERGSSGNTWHRLGFKLVVLELATAVMLLVGAGLLGKSLYRLLNVDLGFEPDRLATLQVAVPRSNYPSDEQLIAISKHIVDRIASLPGVESVGLASVIPVSFNGNTDWIRFVGRPYSGEHNEVNQRDVSSRYLQTLGATLVRGRYFTEADDASRSRVVIINQALARRYFPGEDPIGKKFGNTSLAPESIKEIVGIVADIREGQLDSEIWPAVYYPFNQSADSSFTLVVRTAQSERSILPLLASSIAGLDPDIGTFRETTMSDRITDSPVAYLRRSSVWLLGGFSALALLLGSVGLYGVIAYTVSQRRREIGVRLALGATRGDVFRQILGSGLSLAVAGAAIGVGGAYWLTRVMESLLFSVSRTDPATFIAVPIALISVAALACYLPARRAMRVDPVIALRAD